VAVPELVDRHWWHRTLYEPIAERLQRGGRFRLAPAEPGYVSKQLYLPGSAVLITWFMAPGGLGVLRSAPLGLGYVDEARAFVEWLQDRVQKQAGGGSGPLKIMYRVEGSSDVDALDRACRLDQAVLIFEKMLTYANPSGSIPRRSA
jgi:hypothetical protein